MARCSLPIIASMLLHVWPSIISAVNHECISTTPVNMERCTNKEFKNSVGWNTTILCNIAGTSGGNNPTCRNKGACNKRFRLSIFNQQLFAITMKNTAIKMLKGCCKECAKCSVVKAIDDSMHVNASILNSSDIIFPVLGESTLEKLHGFYFLPSYKVPSSFYFMLKKSNNKIIQEVVATGANMWTLLVLCLLFAMISGFIVWIIETHLNVTEFPRRFHVGLFEGFWWSFVAMTTVGFGDKVPKSYFGRIYAVIWILVGITMCSMFTATLTSEIISAHSPADTDMAGKAIAVMKGRLHDVALVAQHGGMLTICHNGHTMRGINDMITMLENKSVDGFLVDRNTYYHFSNRIKESKYSYIGKRVKDIAMIRSEKSHHEGSLSCGMLVKDIDDYKYFKAYFDSNRLGIRSCNSLRMNNIQSEVSKEANMFAADGDLFITILYYSIIILAVMIVVGALFEGKRYYFRIRSD